MTFNSNHLPGILFTIQASDIKGFPSILRDISPHVRKALSKLGCTGVTISPEKSIIGHSWEMAAIMSAIGEKGTYSGTCAGVRNETIEFGAVPYTHIKRKLDINLQTYADIPKMTFPQTP